jgi:uncharacterized protein YuzE
MIKTSYDPEADVLHVVFGPEGSQYDSAEEVAPGVFVEFDASGAPIGIEVLGVRHRSDAAEVVRAAVAA